jgi:hypothetical protein
MVDIVARLGSRTEQQSQIALRPDMTCGELCESAAAKFVVEAQSICVTLVSVKGEMSYMLSETDFDLTLVSTLDTRISSRFYASHMCAGSFVCAGGARDRSAVR